MRLGKRGGLAGIFLMLMGTTSARADLILGSFDFNSSQFGNSLLESDGGTHSAVSWLNIVNADPGNPAYLTGANFDTGIANIGLFGSLAYTIGYSTPITNVLGNDLGVVVARYSFNDFLMAVSTDGVSFTPDVLIGIGTAVATGVHRNYFYGGSGPFDGELWVHALNLDTFGLSPGASVAAVRITGTNELDLIRVAGLAHAARVPEPGTFALGLGGLAVLAWRVRKSRHGISQSRPT